MFWSVDGKLQHNQFDGLSLFLNRLHTGLGSTTTFLPYPGVKYPSLLKDYTTGCCRIIPTFVGFWALPNDRGGFRKP